MLPARPRGAEDRNARPVDAVHRLESRPELLLDLEDVAREVAVVRLDDPPVFRESPRSRSTKLASIPSTSSAARVKQPTVAAVRCQRDLGRRATR
jgi:hypothetical protein